METFEILTELHNLNYFNDKKIGSVLHFINPKLYSEILKKTECLVNTKYSNQYLRARVIFLSKYNGDITLIQKNNEYFTFDRKLDDFVDKTGNYVKRSWDKIKNNPSIDFYSKEDVVNKLVNDNFYLNFLGKSRNRTLMNKDIILYNSIYRYTEFMNNFNKNSNRLSSRIMFLIKYNNCEDIKCTICKTKYTSFNYKLNDFNKVCKSCFFKNNIHYPNKNFFIQKYKDNWEFFYLKNRKKISEYKVNSRQWFINKYGETDGINNYNIYLKKRINILNNIKTNRYSKISQKLFWNIFNNLTSDEQKLCYFKELNNEKLLKVSENKYYFPDFLFKNKIIEYDGIYWHNDEKDNIRNTYYNNNGYDYLIINENDFSRNNFNLDVINKCIKFLRNEI